MRSVTLPNDVTLPYAEQGNPAGVPLVLLHAIADSWRAFEPLLPHLPPSIHAIAPSQRGHGDASRPATGYRVPDFVADLALFLEALRLPPAVVVGGSSGGFIALREALLALGQPAATIDERGRPTPVTVCDVQRHCHFDTRPNPTAGHPRSLYGGAFARASVAEVIAATRPLVPPTVSNIVAMAAPSYGQGPYTREEIETITITATTGFLAARLESHPMGATVHTGFWGCGAFGGNRTLMTILQALAADLAGAAYETYLRLRGEATSPAGYPCAASGAPLPRCLWERGRGEG